MLVGDYVEDTKSWSLSRRSDGRPHRPRCLSRQKIRPTISARHPRFRGRPDPTPKGRDILSSQRAFDQVNPEDYDALVLPGGRAPEYIRLNPRVNRQSFATSPRRTNPRCVCHAAQYPLPLQLSFEAKECSAYPAVAPGHPGRRHLRQSRHDWEPSLTGQPVTAPAWPRIRPGLAPNSSPS